MTFFEQSVFFGVSVSLAAYGIGVLLQKKFKFALFNPLLISVVLTIAVLLTAHISYDTFYEGAKYLSYLLTPATVCLAVPLYEKLSLLKSNWKAIFAGILSGRHHDALQRVCDEQALSSYTRGIRDASA